MSAVVGLFHRKGRPVAERDLQLAMSATTVYGPDGSGTWIEGHVGLGFQQLHFTPESIAEEQPFVDDRIAVVADARIDNREEVFGKLEVAREERRGMPDSILIAKAYLRWGTESPRYLIGDYAFAVWDRRERRLFCARDHVGARPFYYFISDDLFAFASDIRGVLAFEEVPRELDENEVAVYLLNPIDTPLQETFYRGIQKLRFAHTITVTANGVRHARYWRPCTEPEFQGRSEADLAEALRSRIEEAVACRLRTPFTVGAHLSGGLDSTAITVLAQRQLAAQGRSLEMTYTWSPPKSERYPQMKRDERDLIEQVCRIEGISCYYPLVTAEAYDRFLHRDISLNSTVGLVTEAEILRQTGAHGVRTILSGWGGDEGATYAGRGYAPDLLLKGRLIELGRTLAGWSGRRLRRWIVYSLRDVMMPILPDPFYQVFSRTAERRIPPPLMNAEFDQQTRSIRRQSMDGRERPGVRHMLARLFDLGHLAHRMEGWATWSTPYNMVYTYPLTDRRVLDFVYRVPPKLFVRPHERYLFRMAFDALLPREVTWRLSKYDAATELQRQRMREGVWSLWKASEDKKWNRETHPWLDMSRIRKEIQHRPDQVTGLDLLRFVRLASAVEINELSMKYLKE